MTAWPNMELLLGSWPMTQVCEGRLLDDGVLPINQGGETSGAGQSDFAACGRTLGAVVGGWELSFA
jgi:hypothetical protein